MNKLFTLATLCLWTAGCQTAKPQKQALKDLPKSTTACSSFVATRNVVYVMYDALSRHPNGSDLCGQFANSIPDARARTAPITMVRRLDISEDGNYADEDGLLTLSLRGRGEGDATGCISFFTHGRCGSAGSKRMLRNGCNRQVHYRVRCHFRNSLGKDIFRYAEGTVDGGGSGQIACASTYGEVYIGEDLEMARYAK